MSYKTPKVPNPQTLKDIENRLQQNFTATLEGIDNRAVPGVDQAVADTYCQRIMESYTKGGASFSSDVRGPEGDETRKWLETAIESEGIEKVEVENGAIFWQGVKPEHIPPHTKRQFQQLAKIAAGYDTVQQKDMSMDDYMEILDEQHDKKVGLAMDLSIKQAREERPER